MLKLYLVKDLARETGHSTNTIKYYLWEGLLKEYGRTPHTNVRIFNEKTIRALQRIRIMRKEKLSIKEIKKLLNK